MDSKLFSDGQGSRFCFCHVIISKFDSMHVVPFHKLVLSEGKIVFPDSAADII